MVTIGHMMKDHKMVMVHHGTGNKIADDHMMRDHKIAAVYYMACHKIVVGCHMVETRRWWQLFM